MDLRCPETTVNLCCGCLEALPIWAGDQGSLEYLEEYCRSDLYIIFRYEHMAKLGVSTYQEVSLVSSTGHPNKYLPGAFWINERKTRHCHLGHMRIQNFMAMTI